MKNEEYISFDMRNELYNITGKRIESAQNAFTTSNYETCFKEIVCIETMLSPQMLLKDKLIFKQIKKKIWDLINEYKTLHEKDKKRFEIISNVSVLVELFMETTFKECAAQNIWFPKGRRHDGFDETFAQETFGIKAEKIENLVKDLKKLHPTDLFELMPKKYVEEIHARWVMKNVIQA